MKKSLILVAAVAAAVAMSGCAATAPVPADGGQIINVPAKRVAECQAQGGCGLVSFEELMRGMSEAYDLGVGSVSCRGRGS